MWQRKSLFQDAILINFQKESMRVLLPLRHVVPLSIKTLSDMYVPRSISAWHH